MAPILSLLRHLAETESRRPVTFYYGARGETDLFYLPEILALAERLVDFTFVPCLSHTWPDGLPLPLGMARDRVRHRCGRPAARRT